MIDKSSLSVDWLTQKQAEHKRDPALIESMIHALYLLEQLQLSGLDFIFKGGTSLILLLDQPSRFSVDIDIIVSPAMDRATLESYLDKIVGDVFVKYELDQKRSYNGKIPKAHYKFMYNSNVSTKNKEGEVLQNPQREILLDVLFAENPYPVLVKKTISTPWLIQTGDPISVQMPCENSIAGDKLTAFAPTTIGVPYKADKEKEIIKQLYDIGTLFNKLTDIELFKKSFHVVAANEFTYRPDQKLNIEVVLKDIIATAIIIAKRDTQDEADIEKFDELKKGIGQFNHFVYLGSFRIEEAQVASAKAAYLAAHILTENKGGLNIFNEGMDMKSYLIEHQEYNFLNKKLRFVAKGEALFYWSETIKLLHPPS